MGISETLRRALLERRFQGHKDYRLALENGIHPTVLSHIVNGSIPVRPGDPRVLKIAATLGVPADEAFADEPTVVGHAMPFAELADDDIQLVGCPVHGDSEDA